MSLVVDEDGVPVKGLLGLGLGNGFLPSNALGGGFSLVGHATGLRLWQNAVGAIILEQLLGGVSQEDVADPHLRPSLVAASGLQNARHRSSVTHYRMALS